MGVHYPPHILAVVVGDGQGGPLGWHVHTVEEARTKIKLCKREVHLWFHPTAPQHDGEGGAIHNLGRG